jgi:hypothetical protein
MPNTIADLAVIFDPFLYLARSVWRRREIHLECNLRMHGASSSLSLVDSGLESTLQSSLVQYA